MGLWHLFSDNLWMFAFYAVFVSILIVIAVYDLRHTIIPDEMVVALTALAAIYVGINTYLAKDFDILLWSLVGGFGSALLFGGLWYLSKGRWMGFGDAKLALPLGMVVAFPAAYSMIVFAFLFGAVISVALLIIQKLLKKGKTSLRYSGIPLTMKSEVPFAPFLILGFLYTALFHADIFQITFSILW